MPNSNRFCKDSNQDKEQLQNNLGQQIRNENKLRKKRLICPGYFVNIPKHG